MATNVTYIRHLIDQVYDMYRNRETKMVPIESRKVVFKGPRGFGHTQTAIDVMMAYSISSRVVYITDSGESLRELRKAYKRLFIDLHASTSSAYAESDLRGRFSPGMEYVVVMDGASVIPEEIVTMIEEHKADVFYIMLG